MLIHYHTPKTAGTSFKRVIKQWFDLAHESEMSRNEMRQLMGAENICISGHFGMSLVGKPESLLSIFPEIVSNKNYKVITSVRDPIDHFISYYYHFMKRSEKDARNLPLWEFIENPKFKTFRDFFHLTTSSSITSAFGSFYFVCVSEDMDRSTELLGDMLDRPALEVPYQNIGDRDEQILSLGRKARSRLEQAFALEYEFYETAKTFLSANRPNSRRRTNVDQFSYTGYLPKSGIPAIAIKLEDIHQTPVQEEADAIRVRDEVITTNTRLIQELRAQIDVLTNQRDDLVTLLHEQSGISREAEGFLSSRLERLCPLRWLSLKYRKKNNQLQEELEIASRRNASYAQFIERQSTKIQRLRQKLGNLQQALAASQGSLKESLDQKSETLKLVEKQTKKIETLRRLNAEVKQKKNDLQAQRGSETRRKAVEILPPTMEEQEMAPPLNKRTSAKLDSR